MSSSVSNEIKIHFGFKSTWTDLFLAVYNQTELKRPNRQQVEDAFVNSQIVVSAWVAETPVAIGRAITDFKMYSAIFDVVVDPNFQKMGLGKKIMQNLLEKLEGTCVHLTSTFGNEEFYRKLGFRFHKTAMALYPTKLKDSSYLSRNYQIPEGLQLNNEISFFLGQSSDVEGSYLLNEQLGYKTDYDGFSKRFLALINSSDHSVIVAKKNTEVIAWMHMGIRRLLEDEDFAQLMAVVVSDKYRSLGIGKHLLKIAEDWARFFKFKALYLNSSFPRERAHNFYLKNGYTHLKSSKLFMKDLR